MNIFIVKSKEFKRWTCSANESGRRLSEKNQKPVKGIHIHAFNYCIMILSGIIFLLLIYITGIMPAKYNKLIQHTEDCIACQEDAASLMAASDYLTEQVRLYVQNMDIKYMDAYIEEANVTCRREKALEELQNHEISNDIRNDLQLAMDESRNLMYREIYAMRLISEANHYDTDSLPKEVQDTALKADDSALTPDEMIEKARDLVFNEGYQDAKALIYSHLSHFTNAVISTTHDRQQDSADALSKTLFQQRIFISILFIITVVNFFVITLMIVRPLKVHINRIKDNDTLEIIGSYEFKYLALTYNDIYELNAQNQLILKKKAEHDSLTGLLNRRALEDLQTVFRNSGKPVALAVIDVDNFKKVNDEYGHETGDLMLKHVASLLESSFRSSDYVVRFGGDEFIVILTELKYENMSSIEKKFDRINTALKNPDERIPPVSVSVGLAFSSKGFTDDLFSRADQALYHAKDRGRCNCYFDQTIE